MMSAEDRRWVEYYHPGWRTLAESEQFQRWLAAQPMRILEMGESGEKRGIMAVLDLYKLDRDERINVFDVSADLPN